MVLLTDTLAAVALAALAEAVAPESPSRQRGLPLSLSQPISSGSPCPAGC